MHRPDRVDLVAPVSKPERLYTNYIVSAHETSFVLAFLLSRFEVTVTTTQPDGFGPLGVANPRMPYRSLHHAEPVIRFHQCFDVRV